MTSVSAASSGVQDRMADQTEAATSGKPAAMALWQARKIRFALIILVFIVVEISIIAAFGLFRGIRAVGPTVDLGYARYRGVPDEASKVNVWLGMRYAAAPVGNLRFAAPQDPPTVDQVQDAAKHGKKCLSVGDTPPVSKVTSEDCLFLDVYAPSDTTNESKLPVFFFIQGGGFATNANANYNGRGLINASGQKIIVVTFNYRVGPYGFMAGKEIDSLNNGLKDQRKALGWVKEHIAKFGGDPNHVVIGGDSAGAASIAFHLAAYGGRNDNLFHAAAAESPSFATVLKASESQFLYEAFANATSCTGSNSLACLRALSTNDMQQANTRYPYPQASGLPVFSWNPVMDGELIQDYTYRAFNSGNFIKVPTIFGDDTNGGTIFTPRQINTLADSDTFLTNTFPFLTDKELSTLDELYPGDTATTYPNSGSYWRRTADLYGEMRYMCPNLFLSSAFATHATIPSGIKSWNYRYNVQDPAQIASGVGVPHTVELAAIFGPGNMGGDRPPMSYNPNQSNNAIVSMMQGYWTSFIRTYNPNTYRAAGTPEWKNWDGTEVVSNATSTSSDSLESKEASQWKVTTQGTQQRFLFDSPVSNSDMETVDRSQWERCQYLWGIALDIRQ